MRRGVAAYRVAPGVLAVCVAAATVLPAQGGVGRPESMAPATIDICASIPSIGTRSDTIYGSVRTWPPGALPAVYDTLLLESLAAHFHLPANLTVPALGGYRHAHGERPVNPDTSGPSFEGQVGFTWRRDGRLGAAILTETSLSRPADDSLMRAVSELGAAGELPPFPPNVRADSVVALFTVGNMPDSLRIWRPLAVERVPVWMVSGVIHATRDLGPRYPLEAERREVGDTVLVSFVVDTAGRPLMGTTRILAVHYNVFVHPVLEALQHWNFIPARIAGCPVAQRVEQPFIFRPR